jgi:hypothetical protein
MGRVGIGRPAGDRGGGLALPRRADPQAHIEDEHEQWQERAAQDPAAALFVLPLAPDRLHKDNVSGGPPYGLILPDRSADGLFAAETPMPFVSYLNQVFSHGGFPGRTLPHNQWQLKQALARDLLPL